MTSVHLVLVVLSIALLLFIVLDPFGNMVTLNTLLSTHTPAKRRRIMLRESLIALGILLLCVIGGGALLSALGLDSYTLGISGGIVLFMIALGMVFPARRVMESEGLDDPLVVPIAMPLIAGPGAISIVTVLAEKNPLLTVVGAVTHRRGGRRGHPDAVTDALHRPRPPRRAGARAPDGDPAGDAGGADGPGRPRCVSGRSLAGANDQDD